MSVQRRARGAAIAVCALFLSAVGSLAAAQTAVTTYHNDLARSGFYPTETILTPASVSSGRLSKRFSYAVDGSVYAQPLYLPHVNVSGKVHNVVFVVTDHDSVYAFDADSATPPGGLLWQRSFIDPASGITTVSTSDDIICGDLVPEVGITSTPVIDPVAGTLFVLARTKEPDGLGGHRFVQRLHALSVSTGLDKANSPVEIQASVPGTGDGGTSITFDPLYQHQRAGLVLSKGVVYISWASHCDISPGGGVFYHGWVMGYNASTLQQVSAYVATPNGARAGIWQGGGAPAVDSAGNLYLETGNGTFDANTGGSDLGDSMIKLSSGLSVADYFTPANQGVLDAADLDFGSSGPMLLPDQPGLHPHLAVACGKEGTIFLVDRDNLGQFHSPDDSGVVQKLFKVISGGVWGMPAYWNGHVYYAANSDNLTDFTLSNGTLSTSPAARSNETFSYPGATPAVSGNGKSGAIVWILSGPPGPAILRAYDAQDVSHLLWSSSDLPADQAPPAIKFSVPTVANGHVYVAGDGQLAVYGVGTVQFAKANLSVAEGGSVVVTVQRSQPTGGTVTVDFQTSDGTAHQGLDYTPASGTLTFGPGVTTRTFTVQTLHNSAATPGLTVLLSLGNPTGGVALGIPHTAVLATTNKDVGGKVQFASAAYSVNAATAAGSVKLTVKRMGGMATGVTVHCTMTDGTATGGVDYDYAPKDLTFLSSGTGATTQTLTIPIPQNTSGAKTFTVTLNPPTGGAVLGTPTAATVTILGTEPTLSFSSRVYSVKTTQPTATITVTRSAPLTGTVTVHYATSPGSATNGGVDYTDVSGNLTFAPNVSTRTFSMPITKDALVDTPKTVNLTLSTPNWTLGTAVVDSVLGSSVLTILDPNLTPTVQFSSAKYTVNEATSEATITVKRTGDLVGTVTVDYAATGGSATNGDPNVDPNSDYTLNPVGPLTFGPNQTVLTFTIPIMNDTRDEGTETAQLTLSNPTWTGGTAVVGAIGMATLNITDNEPTVQFSAAAYSVSEAAKSITITVKRTGSLTAPASVTYDVTGGTATRDTGSGGDYSIVVPNTQSFAAGQSVNTFPITLNPDTVADGTKTINLALSSPSAGLALGTPSQAVVTIKDNDTAGKAQFIVSNYSVSEGDGIATITVTRTGGTSSQATVAYTTADADPDTTAVAGTDYASSNGTLTFGLKDASKTFTIPILDDGVANAGTIKTIVLTLGSPGNGLALGSPSAATLWILKE